MTKAEIQITCLVLSCRHDETKGFITDGSTMFKPGKLAHITQYFPFERISKQNTVLFPVFVHIYVYVGKRK